ncbi:MAG: hypothetical protein QG551_171 [Patescibacteria group bacterium]|nr:hypothetical protein [Patescibacteria group bacterium]
MKKIVIITSALRFEAEEKAVVARQVRGDRWINLNDMLDEMYPAEEYIKITPWKTVWKNGVNMYQHLITESDVDSLKKIHGELVFPSVGFHHDGYFAHNMQYSPPWVEKMYVVGYSAER